MYSLRRPPCTTSPFIAVATGLKPFWQPRAPARARAPERCHSVPYVSAGIAAAEAITAVVDLARVSSKKADSWEAAFTARRFVAGVVHHSCRLGAAAARQRGSEATAWQASQTHGYGVCSPESARRDRIRAGGLRHGRRHGRAGELATRSAPGTTPGRHTSGGPSQATGSGR